MKAFSIAAVLCLTIGGCEKAAPRPTIKIVSVTGTVTLDGKPLPGADVVFMGAEPASVFVGKTDDKGDYQLQGAGNAMATCQGKFRVTISRLVKPDGTLPAPDEPPANSGAVETLPRKYSDAATTELSAEVPESGGKFDFPLQSR